MNIWYIIGLASLGSLCIAGLADMKWSNVHHCRHLGQYIASHMSSLYPEDATCCTTSSDCTVSLDNALKVALRPKQLCALVHVSAYGVFLDVVKGRLKDDWCVMTVTFSVSHIQKEHLCLLHVRVVLSSYIQITVIDIPPHPPPNNLRWPVSSEARADVLCHWMCWRVSGSMSSYSWDGEE